MSSNVVRKRIVVGSSQSDALPPVLVRLPTLAGGGNAHAGTQDTTQVAPADDAAQLTGAPDQSGGELESDRPAARVTEEPWWTLDHPVWQHWGTKAGLVVGACLLLLVLYQVVGKKDADKSPAGKGGQVATSGETEKAHPAKQNKPPAARQALKPNRPGVPKGGAAAKKPVKGQAKQTAQRPQPGKLPAGQKVAGGAKKSPAADTSSASPAKQFAQR